MSDEKEKDDQQPVLRKAEESGEEAHRPHPFPQYDPHYCSCCRKRFVAGLDNVINIPSRPEQILDFAGNVIGQRDRPPLAALHGVCANGHFGVVFECKYCGTFARTKTAKLRDTGEIVPIETICKCSCHGGGTFCSLLIV